MGSLGIDDMWSDIKHPNNLLEPWQFNDSEFSDYFDSEVMGAGIGAAGTTYYSTGNPYLAALAAIFAGTNAKEGRDAYRKAKEEWKKYNTVTPEEQAQMRQQVEQRLSRAKLSASQNFASEAAAKGWGRGSGAITGGKGRIDENYMRALAEAYAQIPTVGSMKNAGWRPPQETWKNDSNDYMNMMLGAMAYRYARGYGNRSNSSPQLNYGTNRTTGSNQNWSTFNENSPYSSWLRG